MSTEMYQRMSSLFARGVRFGLRLSTLCAWGAACVGCKASSGAGEAPPNSLSSAVYEWAKLEAVATDKGERRAVFEGRTATVDKLHAHITTLGPGLVSGEPRLHVQEEVIIVKEGTIEANFDGQARVAGPGSVIFFQSNAVTFLRNVGTTPATYYVIYYYTPLTPKG